MDPWLFARHVVTSPNLKFDNISIKIDVKFKFSEVKVRLTSTSSGETEIIIRHSRCGFQTNSNATAETSSSAAGEPRVKSLIKSQKSQGDKNAFVCNVRHDTLVAGQPWFRLPLAPTGSKTQTILLASTGYHTKTSSVRCGALRYCL